MAVFRVGVVFINGNPLVSNFSKPAPKLVRDDTPDPCEIVLKGHFGSDGALMAAVNTLRGLGVVKQGRYEKRQDGSIVQTLTIEVYELAKSYATRPERPYEDKSADLYVFQSQLDADVFKVGISIHVPVRVKQVSNHFQEPFKRIHSVHCENAKQRETWVHNTLREMGAVDLGHEKFRLKERHLAFLYSLENE